MASVDYLPPLRHDGQATDDYKVVTVAPIAGSLGAKVSGVDLSDGLDGDLLADIHRALLNHLVLVFPGQELSAEQLIALGKTFGSLHVNPFVAGLPDHPEIMQIRSEENETARFAGRWHSDITWEARPSMGSLLHARTIPAYGGDTLFANMYMAWEALTPTMRRTLDGLQAEHTAFQGHGRAAAFADAPEVVTHPLARTHPETGRKALFVNEYFTCGILGMTSAESQPLLDFLFRHLQRPEFTMRVRWTENALVFWDNRCTQHYAANDYPGDPRLMWRVTINGDKPY